MKKQDERVLAQERRIGSDAFQILFYGLLVSIFVQQFLFDAPFSQYAVEVILLIAASIYIVVRNLMVGNNLFASEKGTQKLVVVNSLVCGLVVAAATTILNYVRLGELFKADLGNTALISGITFLFATATAFVPFEILYVVNRKKQQQIEKRLNEDEESILSMDKPSD